MMNDEYENGEQGGNKILLHLMVVGFHHKKGCQVSHFIIIFCKNKHSNKYN